MSKVISRLLNFFLLHSVRLVSKTRATFSTNETKPKPIVIFSHAFSRAWHQLQIFASHSDWLIALFTSVMIGQSNFFAFGSTTTFVTLAFLEQFQRF